MRYTLVDGHGNFGSIDGDPPAAYRYTESRMSKMALKMLTDIDKNTIDFTTNYDDRLKEPTVLPSRFPNILVNENYAESCLKLSVRIKLIENNLRICITLEVD